MKKKQTEIKIDSQSRSIPLSAQDYIYKCQRLTNNDIDLRNAGESFVVAKQWNMMKKFQALEA